LRESFIATMVYLIDRLLFKIYIDRIMAFMFKKTPLITIMRRYSMKKALLLRAPNHARR
jgi:hypothetical protein